MALGTSPSVQAQNARAAKEAGAALAKVLDQIGVGGKEGLADVGISVTNRVKELLSIRGTGRTYRVGKNVLHRASSPYRPPAVDTGRLRSSYTWQTGEDRLGPYVEIGTNVVYAPWLEFGTSRMEPRPHLRPAVETLRKDLVEKIADGIIERQRTVAARLPKEIR